MADLRVDERDFFVTEAHELVRHALSGGVFVGRDLWKRKLRPAAVEADHRHVFRQKRQEFRVERRDPEQDAVIRAQHPDQLAAGEFRVGELNVEGCSRALAAASSIPESHRTQSGLFRQFALISGASMQIRLPQRRVLRPGR